MRCPVMIGRQVESALLGRAVAAATAGAGGVVVVLGEAGIGKSRLVIDAVEQAASTGLTVLRGRGVAGEAPPGLRPLSEAVLGGLRRFGVPRHPELEPFHPALARLAPQYVSGLDVGPVSLVVLAEAVLRLARMLVEGRAALIVLEDLHWADPETLSVVEYLADNLANEPILVLVTMRDEAPGAAVDLARSLSARGVAESIVLGRLDDDAVAEMLGACLEGQTVPPELNDLVVARAGGLPLLVEELLAGLRAQDALTRRNGRWTVNARTAPPVPASFAETVARRLATLPPSAGPVVGAAAVLGTDFDWRLLAPTSGRTQEQVLGALRRAMTANLIVGDQTGFRFRHGLTRDAVLAAHLAPERAAWAGRAAAAVVAADAAAGADRLELAAELFELAGRPELAADTWHAAARRDLLRGALTTAKVTLERARALVPEDRDRQLAIDETMVDVLGLAGETERALALGESLLSIVDSDRLGAARLRVARAALAAGQWAEAERQLAAVGAPDATVLALRSQAAMGELRVDDARVAAEGSLERAGSDQPEVACEALEVLGRAARLTDLVAAEAQFERAYRIADAHDLRLWRVRALHELGTIDLLDGRGDERRLLAARQAALDIGALSTAAAVNLQLNAIRVVNADFEGALEAITLCVDSSRRLRLPLLPKALLHLAAVRGLLGQTRQMEEALEQARAAGPTDPEVPAGQYGHARFLQALWQADDELALEMLDRAMPTYRDHPALPTPFRGIWALLHSALRDGSAAREEVRTGPQLTTRYNWLMLRYADAVALGRDGRGTDAQRLLATIPRDGPGNDFWMHEQARRVTAAAALRDGWGEPTVWLRRSLAWFETHAQPYGAVACRALLREAGVPVPRSGPAAADVPERLRGLGVTAREMQVLRLVRAGLTNGDIAARLYLSPRTVETHVARLLRRTGARGRAGLVALTSPDE